MFSLVYLFSFSFSLSGRQPNIDEILSQRAAITKRPLGIVPPIVLSFAFVPGSAFVAGVVGWCDGAG